MPSITNSIGTKSASKFRLPTAVLLCGISLLASLSIFARNDFALFRVPTAVLAEADRHVARYGPALIGSTCAVDGSVSKDPRGVFLMCWKQIWARPY